MKTCAFCKRKVEEVCFECECCDQGCPISVVEAENSDEDM